MVAAELKHRKEELRKQMESLQLEVSARATVGD